MPKRATVNTSKRFKLKSVRDLVPPWNMPSDPVKAVLWFLHWFLRVLVHFFWLPIGVMCVYELVANWMAGGAWNGIVSAFVTLFVGMLVWGILYAITLAVNFATRVSQVIANVSRLQDQMPGMSGFSPFDTPFGQTQQDPPRTRIVEGTITDLEEERRRRRSES